VNYPQLSQEDLQPMELILYSSRNIIEEK
jgi:hypothetical protein